MNSDFLLVEHLSNVNTIIKQPLQQTRRIKFTCFDVSKNYMVFGASSGGLYVFNRYPHQFIKLIPTKEGSVALVCISPNERHIALTTLKGIVIIIQNCFFDANFEYETYGEHSGDLVTAMRWGLDELYCGDNSGKVTVIALPSLLAKAIFQVTCATLMKLESSIIEIDVYFKFLLISTFTRTYICDTDKEEYRQIGKKLRRGRYGACFFTNNVDSNVATPELFTNKGAFKKLKDDEQFLTHISDNIQIFCCRPGARMWEAKLNASVVRTHQFKNSFKQKSTDVIQMDDDTSINFNINTDNDFKQGSLINFTKTIVLCNKFILTFGTEGFCLFDPESLVIMCWCNHFKNILDLKIIDNFIYIWDYNLEIHIIALYTLEKIILKTLFNKQYYICAQLCVQYNSDVLSLINSSKRIHLVSVLKDKLIETSQSGLLEKLLPTFEAIKNYSDKTYIAQKLKTGIVVVNPYVGLNDEVKEEKDPPLNLLKGISSNVTEKLTESTKNLKEKLQILETTVKNLTLSDTVPINGASNMYISNGIKMESDNCGETSDCNAEVEFVDVSKYTSKIFRQQYQLSKIDSKLETPKFYELLNKHDLNTVVELFNNFLNEQENVEEDYVKLWCYNYYLKYLSKIDFEQIIECYKSDDLCLHYACNAFCKLNCTKSGCVCLYPLPSAKDTVPLYYNVGCTLIKKYWCTNRQRYDEVTSKVPYLWKYILKDLRINDHIGILLPLLMQFGDEELIGFFSNKFKYDEWDDAIQLLIKLRKYKCVNCDNKFDVNCNVMSWANFGTIMMQSIGASNTIHLLMRSSSSIPSDELDVDFYQKCIFSTVVSNFNNEANKKAISFAKIMQNDEAASLEFDNVLKKFLQRSHVKLPLSRNKKNGFLNNTKTDLNCCFCDLPIETPLLKEGIRLSCTHLYHRICLNYNQNICKKCMEFT